MTGALTLSIGYFTEQLDEHWRLAEGAAGAWERANIAGEQTVYPIRSYVMMLVGRWAEARAEAETALPFVQHPSWSRWWWYVPYVLGEIAHGQGETETAWARIGLLLASGAQ